MKAEVVKLVPTELNEALVVFLEAKRAIEAAEAKKRSAEAILKSACQARGGSIELNNMKVKLVEAARETFDLKNARTQIHADLLKPFIKVSVYDYVRVS